MSHLIALASSWFLLAGAQAPTEVSVEIRATTAERTIQTLAAQTGLPLAVSPKLKDLILLIRTERMPVDTLLKHLAAAMEAEWVTVDGKQVLQRSRAIEDRIVRTEREEVARDLRRQLDSIARGASSMSVGDADALIRAYQAALAVPVEPGQSGSLTLRMKALSERTPASNALKRLAALLDPNVLAQMEHGDRMVFALKPHALQRPLPGEAALVVAQLAQEQAIWAERAASLIPPPSPDMYQRIFLESRAEIPDGLARVLLVATSVQGVLSLELLAYDGTGRLRVSAQRSAEQAIDTALANGFVIPGAGAPTISVSESSRGYEQTLLTATAMPGPTLAGLASPLRDQFLNPETADPLSFATSDLLLGLARTEQRSLIAQVPDDAAVVAMLAAGTDRVLGGIVQALANQSFRFERPPGVLVAAPRRRSTTERTMMRREVFGLALRLVAKQGYLTGDQRAQFAFRQGDSPIFGVGAAGFFQQLNSQADPFVVGVRRDLGLRLLGSLQGAQTRLVLGEGIELGGLRPEQQDLARRLIVGALSERRSRGRTVAPHPMSLDEEVTEVLAGGIPRTARLSLQIQEEERVLAMVKPAGTQVASPKSFTAQEIALAEHSKVGDWLDVVPGSLRRRVDRRTTVRVTLTDRFTAEETVPDTLEVAIENLRGTSPAFQAAIADELARRRRGG